MKIQSYKIVKTFFRLFCWLIHTYRSNSKCIFSFLRMKLKAITGTTSPAHFIQWLSTIVMLLGLLFMNQSSTYQTI